MCQLCPEPALAGVSKFGCDTYRRRCSCGRVQTTYDRCSANRQCRSDSQCMLVSSMDNRRYGSIPCSMCPSVGQVLCVLPTEGFPGQCSCVMDLSAGFDGCAGPTGTVTVADASKLCLYVHGYSGSSNAWSFDMEDLMVMKCTQATRVVCSAVAFPTRGTLMVAVAYEVRTFSSGGRRLLQADALGDGDVDPWTPEDWAGSSPYCRMAVELAARSVRLGPSDAALLEGCLYWRRVGRKLVGKYNLTAMPDTMFLSFEDFASAVASQEGFTELLQSRWFLLDAFLYHPLAKPLRAFGAHVVSQMEVMIDAWKVKYGHEEDGADPFGSIFDSEPDDLEFEPIGDNLTAQPEPEPTGRRGRRLLTIQDDAAAVKAYSAQVIEGVTPALDTRGTGLWSVGVFQWPPRYDYSLNACPIAKAVLNIGYQVAVTDKAYYEAFNKPRPRTIQRGIRANLPRVNWTLPVLPERRRSAAASVYAWVLGLVGLTPAHVVAFFTTRQEWTLSWIIETYVQCDLPAVLTCANHTKDLAASLLLILLVYVFVQIFANAMGVPIIATLFFVSIPSLVLWYSFGVAPSCFPLIPPCVLGDFIELVESILPRHMTLPSRLQCGVNQTCLVSCTELGFTSWERPLVFSVCDLGVSCDWLGGSLPFINGTASDVHHILALGTDDDLAAQRLCTWVTFVSVVPYLLVFATVLVIASALLLGVLSMLHPVALALGNIYMYIWT